MGWQIPVIVLRSFKECPFVQISVVPDAAKAEEKPAKLKPKRRADSPEWLCCALLLAAFPCAAARYIDSGSRGSLAINKLQI